MYPQLNPSMNEKSSEERILYFGYGSNLDKDDWKRWCERNGHDPNGLKEIGPAWIDGYQLIFDYYSNGRKGGAANIKETSIPGRATAGALFEVDNLTLLALDQKEGHPHSKYYQRSKVKVSMKDGIKLDAVTYIHHAVEDNFYPPTREYENLIRKNLLRLGLSTKSLDNALENKFRPNIDHIFVYGTLLSNNSRNDILSDDCEFIANGTVSGDLYRIHDYPGLIAGDGNVSGEIYRIQNPEKLIDYLDMIEGVNRDPPLFNRVILQVETDKGKIWSYSYQYADTVKGLEKINSGKWNAC